MEPEPAFFFLATSLQPEPKFPEFPEFDFFFRALNNTFEPRVGPGGGSLMETTFSPFLNFYFPLCLGERGGGV